MMKHDDIASHMTSWTELLLRLVPLATRLAREVARLVRREGSPAYCVESFDAELVLHDRRGQRATYHKRERVRFMYDGVQTLTDFNWGGGRQFLGHRVAPGKVTGSAAVGSRVRHLIELPRVIHRGQRLTLRSSRQIRGAFTRRRDRWLESEVYHPTDRLTMRVVFPAGPQPRGARVRCLLRHTDESLTARTRRGGGCALSFTMRRPAVGERITISWTSM